jgi:two-component system sensor histidine kinase UhpB
MSLRVKLHLLIAALTLVLVATMVALFVDDTRRSVGEEITASSRIAQQLLSRLILVGAQDGLDDIAEYLRGLGRVRSNDIVLYDADGHVLYHSPEPTYKAGRSAPDGFARWVQPTPQTRSIEIGRGGRLVIRSEASRAVLDGWDDMKRLLGVALALFAAVNVIVYVVVGRAVTPFERILRGLREMERGDFHVRLPALRGREAGAMGAAFNHMAAAIESSLEARREAAESAARLAAQQTLTGALHARIEEERRALARELHDELGQQVTAIRSLALAIARRAEDDGAMRNAVQALTATANQLYDSMHAMVPRLRPLALDSLGLVDAVADLVDDWRLRTTGIRYETALVPLGDEPGDAVRIGAYRIVQEALSNAVRHARPARIEVRVAVEDGALAIAVADDGIGLPDAPEHAGRFGLRGMRERAEALGGRLQIASAPGAGCTLRVRIPLGQPEPSR